jgi:hypothetical protein
MTINNHESQNPMTDDDKIELRFELIKEANKHFEPHEIAVQRARAYADFVLGVAATAPRKSTLWSDAEFEELRRLYCDEGFSARQAAEKMGRPRNTVQQKVYGLGLVSQRRALKSAA